MSRHDDQRLVDILAAAEAIAAHVSRGGFDDGLIFDGYNYFGVHFEVPIDWFNKHLK